MAAGGSAELDLGERDRLGRRDLPVRFGVER